MSRTVPSWLDDPVCLVVGTGAGVEAAAHELAAAGATIARGPLTENAAEALAALETAQRAARDPVTIVLHASGNQDIAARAYGEAFTQYLAEANLKGTILLIEPVGADMAVALKTLAGPRVRANAIGTTYVTGGAREKLRALGALAAYLVSEYAAYVCGAHLGVDRSDRAV
ncbi:MAG TPA: hypothetical protein DHV57_11195 [Hyphomonas sp.]|jgi:hypothetical protein|uniref:hypothetical protein n=1 Tax=Hyphomonas sp. UBA5107 TaxID=1946636 RepID=UPI000C5516DF|nr:hypothetical protein [Hyphomonas sp. UBA5107]MAA93064.1 hypothetical protein [Rheinheimera sp.]MAN65699.1 hypothetical protein [Hyphomonadaceae bacterium]HBL92389.1 hypothetical protein [Hyphomonas sp.]MAA95281.1 hypothetical protein [Rheinheimera sp.]HCJ17971.1 hypothetical protein [Hyphomonas sp.]|tara:strand:- start:21925 stop:22437 length:513 start_codon:yes stop_codon:yes gene_type:complete